MLTLSGTVFGLRITTKTDNCENKKNRRPTKIQTMAPSASELREKNRMYKGIERVKKKNLAEGRDECEGLPHQDKIHSRSAKTKKIHKETTRSNKKRKANSLLTRFRPKSAKYVHEALEDLSSEIEIWAQQENEKKKKSRRFVKKRSEELKKIQKKIFDNIDLKWECNVTYCTPEGWKFGDFSVCNTENISKHSYLLKVKGLDWFEVKPSLIEGAGLGLFAARVFEKNSLLLGIFMGQYDPDDEKSTGYQFKNIDPHPNGQQGDTPYFGLHFANDPFYKKDIKAMTKKQARNLKQKINIEFGGGYDCRTIRRIEKGSEIFVLYEATKTLKALKELNDSK